MMVGRPVVEICRELAGIASNANDDVLAQLLRMAALHAAATNLHYNDEDTQIKDLLVGVWDWDVANDLIYTEGRFAQLFGVPAAQAAKGMPLQAWLDAIHPDDVEFVLADIERALHGSPFAREYRVICNGQTRWVYARGRCTLDGNGQPVRFPGAIVEITQEKITEDNLSIVPL